MANTNDVCPYCKSNANGCLIVDENHEDCSVLRCTIKGQTECDCREYDDPTERRGVSVLLGMVDPRDEGGRCYCPDCGGYIDLTQG